MTSRVRGARKAPADPARVLAVACARAADDKRADDVTVLHLAGIASFADYFVLATAGSTVQLDAVCEGVEEAVDSPPRHREGGRGNPWRLLDYGDVVVHAFLRDARQFYALDRLYADAPRIAWKERARPRTKKSPLPKRAILRRRKPAGGSR